MNFDLISYIMGTANGSSSGDLSDATATRADILYPKTAYLSNGRKNTGTIQSMEAATYTPSITTQTISAGKYLAGDQTIIGDANLVANNIRKNVSIFGVTGNYEGQVVVDDKPVRFIDYDGTVVYTYTSEEFATLLELPANPSHEGLVAQGWNWTLADAKTHVADYGSLDIGQMYTTASGATEIDIKLEAPYLSPYLILALDAGIEIDWGDESEIQSITNGGQVAIQHTYSSAGNYTISLYSEGQNITFYGDFTNTSAGVLSPTNRLSQSTLYSSTIQEIRLGSNAKIDTGAFALCYQMKAISIPKRFSIIPMACFYHCLKLKTIVIPSTIATLGFACFSGCFSLNSACIPKSVSTIVQEAFYDCTHLQNISLSETIITIQAEVFKKCDSLEKIILPSSITFLGEGTFESCKNLQQAVITQSVSSLPAKTFYICESLTSISLPKSIKTINSQAFQLCSSLQSISIPSAVTEIKALAFNSCYSLTQIHFLPSAPPTVVNSNAFTDLPTNCIIYVPSGSLSAYTSATNYPSSSTYTYVEE